MPVSRFSSVCFLVVIAAVNAVTLAGDPFTCTYQLRIEEGFLGDVPWTADVQVGVGEELSYSLCLVNDSVIFSLIDEEADVVYCGVIRDGEFELSHKWENISDWTSHFAFTGGFCHRLRDAPPAERETSMGAESYYLSEQLRETAREFDAVIPEILHFKMEAGLEPPDREHVHMALDDLHSMLLAQESDPAEQHVTEAIDPCRLTMTTYFTTGLFSDEPFEATLRVSVDSACSCNIREVDGGYEFALVSVADQVQHEGRISDGEIRLQDRYGLHERGVSDSAFVDVRELLQRSIGSPDQQVLALFEYVSTRNLHDAFMYSYAAADGKPARPLASFITDVTLEPGEFDWNDDRLPATLQEFHRIVIEMEPPHRPWWQKILRNLDS